MTEASPPPQTLGTDEVHVWLSSPDDAAEPDLLNAYQGLLAPDELARYRRFRFERQRRAYLVSHALVRTTLSRYAALAPGRWVFIRNAHGRPEIGAVRDLPPLRFNLSHTDGLVACAVTLARDIGIDVESHARRRINLRVADRFFAPGECAALERMRAAERPAGFLALWTLKEAYIKARGLGLALPLRLFAFALSEEGVADVIFDERLGDNASAWQFELTRPGPGYVLSLAVRTGGDTLKVRYQRTRPLCD